MSDISTDILEKKKRRGPPVRRRIDLPSGVCAKGHSAVELWTAPGLRKVLSTASVATADEVIE